MRRADRSIPARTGEPSTAPSTSCMSPVYPRAYGGTPDAHDMMIGDWGLSPRVRGNLYTTSPRSAPSGSIPARTGEPTAVASRLCPNAVYPRAYGGTNPPFARTFVDGGLSPRVRGNHLVCGNSYWLKGSIPARTGEPPCLAGSIPVWRVYPRAYGGTRRLVDGTITAGGLSPRVRGNQPQSLCHAGQTRSIPARTGEPVSIAYEGKEGKVYPRAYGGTLNRSHAMVSKAGLSPRVRGNLATPAAPPETVRSIPARTGEPAGCGGTVLFCRVYPRAYGGTIPGWLAHRAWLGLSPRVRGNLQLPAAYEADAGSIPARTGEPQAERGRLGLRRVYPRAYGGTATCGVCGASDGGLSPRVRGNPAES